MTWWHDERYLVWEGDYVNVRQNPGPSYVDFYYCRKINKPLPELRPRVRGWLGDCGWKLWRLDIDDARAVAIKRAKRIDVNERQRISNTDLARDRVGL